jgi:hypothetical protein
MTRHNLVMQIEKPENIFWRSTHDRKAILVSNESRNKFANYFPLP